MYYISIFLFALLLLFACSENNPGIEQKRAEQQDELPEEKPFDTTGMKIFTFTLDTNEHYRGLDNRSNLLYAAGSIGNVYSILPQVTESGPFPHIQEINHLDSTHFRDVEVLKDGSILFQGIASPGRIYRTKGNQTELVYENTDSLVFMDGLDSWSNGTVLAYGDPLDGYHFLLKSTDFGKTWNRIPKEKLPVNLHPEAGFAASGTGVVCRPGGVAYVAWGGLKSRIFKTGDYGESWEVIETPIAQGTAGRGIYSMVWKDGFVGMTLGGNWEEPEGDSTVAYTQDGGQTWSLGTGSSGYRSGGCFLSNEVFVSVGTKGTDITMDGGKTWRQIDPDAMNAARYVFSRKCVVTLGNYGKGKVFYFPNN